MSSAASNGGLVIENSLVNNATNLTLILGLAAIFGSAAVMQKGISKRQAKLHAEFHRINRLNLLFTLIALFLFTGTLWALAKDGVLDFYDGLVLVGLFLFWQVLHVFEVLKDNIRKEQIVPMVATDRHRAARCQCLLRLLLGRPSCAVVLDNRQPVF